MFILLYACAGACAGIMAGLLGVGGGLIIVPMLAFIFTQQHVQPEVIQHLALGTSLASIMFTSISSMRAHHKRKAVEWPIVLRITPGILAGGIIGSWLAAQLSTRMLKVLFVVFLFSVAVQMLLDLKPKTHQRPGMFGFISVGSLIGGISSLVGIGGGTMSVPFMLRCNVTMHNAIGTSAAIGFPIALAGAVGYAVNGWNTAALPAGSIGYIYLPALCGVALASIFTAPLGARLAHGLPIRTLKKIFAGLLIVIGSKMLAGLL
jgi:uncharacterized membrane protein YfcA